MPPRGSLTGTLLLSELPCKRTDPALASPSSYLTTVLLQSRLFPLYYPFPIALDSLEALGQKYELNLCYGRMVSGLRWSQSTLDGPHSRCGAILPKFPYSYQEVLVNTGPA